MLERKAKFVTTNGYVFNDWSLNVPKEYVVSCYVRCNVV